MTSRTDSPVGMLLIGLFLALGTSLACSSSRNGAAKDPNEISRKAIASGSEQSWYSSKKQDYETPKEIVRDNLADRMERISQPRTPIATTVNSNFWKTFLSYAAWSALVFTLTLVAVALLFFFFTSDPIRFMRGSGQRQRSATKDSEARIMDLPFELEPPVAGLLAEAERYMREKNYSKAILYLFSHILIELDAARRIRLQRGKTNGMYLRELRRFPELRAFVRKNVLAFEWVFFGRHELVELNFMECWNGLQQFNRMLLGDDDADARRVEPTATIQGATQ